LTKKDKKMQMISMTDKERDALLDELLKGCNTPADILGKGGLADQIKKRLVERALSAEMTHHLGYEPDEKADKRRSNTRNGRTKKTVMTETQSMEIEVPRDREGSFEPQLVQKRQRRIDGFDDKVIAMYARGRTTREIQQELGELYGGATVSRSLISNVTAAVIDDAKEWQSRPLDAVYPILYFDALFVKSREDGPVKNKAVYLALGINMQGEKEVLGMWMSETEGAKFWMSVFSELKSRGVQDCFVACVDGLKGLPEAIEAVFPETLVQLCIVHKVRGSLKYVSWKDRKSVARDLRAIYTAATLKDAENALDDFEDTWNDKYPVIAKMWRADWERLTVFFDFPPEIRKVIYTTNAIESLNYSLRRVLKKRGAFPNDDSITKILYLALNNAARRWTRPVMNWKAALNQFAILFGERVKI
jgi:putative transposase